MSDMKSAGDQTESVGWCSNCGEKLVARARFCSTCGNPREPSLGNTVHTGGGGIAGGLYQAGGDIVLSPAKSDVPSATYEAVPRWRSPLTLAALTWLSVALGLATLAPLWRMIAAVLDLLREGDMHDPDALATLVPLCVFAVLVLGFVLAQWLRRIAKTQTRWPLRFGWAINGSGRRITLEEIRTARCPKCGGALRYYNKPRAWIDHVESSGRRRREVTERAPALECRRNANHWFDVDPAEQSSTD